MKKYIFAALLIGAGMNIAQAASRGPIAITAQLVSSNYTVQIDGWQDDQGNLLPMGGSQFLTLKNSSGEIVENKLVLNSPYGNNTLDGVGKTYEVIVSLGQRLKNENGLSGFISDMQTLTQDKTLTVPASAAADYDIVVALMDQQGKISLIDTGKMTVSPR